MKQLTKRKVIFLALSLCACIVLAVLLFGIEYSSTRAYADDVVTYSSQDEFTFSLYNNNTEYKVSARNKSMTDATIPSSYNGLPVTEIADNGFMNCANLKSITVPHTVLRIGNNAFANCKNLETVKGMPCLEKLGNNAFAMCTKLTEPVLPDSINTLGSTVFRNNSNTIYVRKAESEMNALNANWKSGSNATFIYGNEVALSEVYGDDGDTLEGYSIRIQQNINTDVDFVLGDTYNGLPLLEIEQYAFAFSSFKSFTLRHGEIITDADSSDESALTTISDCDHTVNIASGAFLCLDAQFVNLTVDVTFNDEFVDDSTYEDYEQGHSTDVFSGCTARSIMLPNNLDMIPRTAFSECVNLREITNTDPNVDVNRLSSNITTIGTLAFSDCSSMLNLYIPSSVTVMGNSVFNRWGDYDVAQAIHLEDLYESPVGQDGYDWDENWLGATYDNLTVNYKTLTVVFDKNGGKDDVGTVSVKVMYNQSMPVATAPERDNYYFQGYYSGLGDGSIQYYDKDMVSKSTWSKKQDGILYARWDPYQYTVTFEKQGGNGGTSEVTASFGEPMPEAQKPDRMGYTFCGYFTESDGGDMYYNADMTSARNYDIGNAVTLYAHWTPNAYTITFYYDDTVLYVCNTVYYDEALPQVSFDLPSVKLRGFYTEHNGVGTMYYDGDLNATNVSYKLTNNINLYAVRMSTRINYDLGAGLIRGVNHKDNPTKVYYEDIVVLKEPKRRGYAFVGWELGSEYVTVLRHLTDEEITLTAKWKGRMISISSSNRIVHISDDEYITVSLPQRTSLSCEIYVDSDNVKQLHVIDLFKTYEYLDLRIIIRNRSTDFTLILTDVYMSPLHIYSDPMPAISMQTTNNSKLLLYAYGKVNIKGTDGSPNEVAEDGGCAISCSTLFICHADNLTLLGGNGGRKNPDTVGGNGGNAVIAQEDVMKSSKANVYCCGGYHASIEMCSGGYSIKSGRQVIEVECE